MNVVKWLSVRVIICIVVGLVALSTALYLVVQFNPWPSSLILRRAMNGGGLARALEKHVPSGINAVLNERYRVDDPDASLDVFSPLATGSEEAFPTIIWIHGGAWLGGSKDQVANYLKILASRGYTTIGVNYSLAPGTIYPAQLLQIDAALDHIVRNAARLHVDPGKLFLAGDSSGAQMAAQIAAMLSAPDYARTVGFAGSIKRSQLRGVILYCGSYDFQKMKIGPGGIETALWAYIGDKAFRDGPQIEQLSVAHHVTGAFPPIFISVGNADWLAPQSRIFADVVQAQGGQVERFFVPEDHLPKAYHEFQFDLDSDAGQSAMERSVGFIQRSSR